MIRSSDDFDIETRQHIEKIQAEIISEIKPFVDKLNAEEKKKFKDNVAEKCVYLAACNYFLVVDAYKKHDLIGKYAYDENITYSRNDYEISPFKTLKKPEQIKKLADSGITHPLMYFALGEMTTQDRKETIEILKEKKVPLLCMSFSAPIHDAIFSENKDFVEVLIKNDLVLATNKPINIEDANKIINDAKVSYSYRSPKPPKEPTKEQIETLKKYTEIIKMLENWAKEKTVSFHLPSETIDPEKMGGFLPTPVMAQTSPAKRLENGRNRSDTRSIV